MVFLKIKGMSMKKELRIKKNEEFQKIIHDQKKVSNQSFVVYYQSNQLSHPRYGITTSKKVGNAVTRNRIRRQIKAMIRQNIENKDIDYVIIVRRGFLEKNYLENCEELKKIFDKIRRIIG